MEINLGINSAFLSIGAVAADSRIRVYTGRYVRRQDRNSEEIHGRLALYNISYVVVRFSDTMDQILQPVIGLCFIDADHTYDGTIHYLKNVRPRMKSDRVIVFDDITWSEVMKVV